MTTMTDMETEIEIQKPLTAAVKSYEQLVEDLKNGATEKIRYNAARDLGEMGDPAAVEPLIEALKHDRNGSARLYAARALGEL